MFTGDVLHYRIVRHLGTGATGEVYLAEDQRVGRPVVLKFLAAVHATDGDRLDRLRQEARALAGLRHPHIAGLHALQTEWTQPFLVLEYVDGETLHDVLQLGPLPAADVVRIGLAISEALAHAHARDIIHRDIKPENILIGDGGDIRLTDFGIASSSHAGTGDIYGTADYMSPEQARGDPLDGRSDLFSLGVVLYEAVTGIRPFRPDEAPGPGHADERRTVLAPRMLIPTVPPGLDALIVRCLAPSATARPHDAREVVTALRALLPGGAGASPVENTKPSRLPRWARATALAVAALLAAALLPVLDDPPPVANRDMLLVLPVEIHGQPDGGGWVGRAFASALVEHLTRDADVHAIHSERPPSPPPPDVRWVLRGSVRREDGLLEADFTLFDALQHRVLWEAERTAPEGALPLLASDVARELTDALGARTAHRYDYFLARIESPVLAASPLTSEALGLSRRYDPSALDATRRLIAAFPAEPEALVLHAYAVLDEYWETNGDSPARAEFERTLRQLDEADPRNPWDEVLRASIAHRNGDPATAIKGFTSVLQRDDLGVGARAYVLGMRGQALRDLDRLAWALADLEQAVRLDATNDVTLVILSEALRLAGRTDEAVERARQAVSLAPEAPHAQFALGQALGSRGAWAEALVPLRHACRLSPCQSYCGFHALALLRAGQKAAAHAEAVEAASMPESDWGAFQLSRYHAARGDGRTALRLLRRSFDLGYKDPEIELIREFETIRAEPQFVSMLDEIRERTQGLSD